MNLAAYIRDVPDFPKEGIVFKDITPLLKDLRAFRTAIEQLTQPYKSNPPDLIVAVESRGFIFATPMAQELGCGFAPVRKPGKLPAETASRKYELEYGSDEVEIHIDAVARGDRVLIVDDLLATGGTAAATAELIESLGGEVSGLAFLIELDFLNGRAKLQDYEVHSIIHYGAD
jgi:adenine phosphoribosyltransferase